MSTLYLHSVRRPRLFGSGIWGFTTSTLVLVGGEVTATTVGIALVGVIGVGITGMGVTGSVAPGSVALGRVGPVYSAILGGRVGGIMAMRLPL